MTVFTHVAFATLISAMASSPKSLAVACALGSTLPDLDSPMSSIGRLLFPLSIPLNAQFGHRGLIHSFILWTALLAVSVLAGSKFAAWVFIGAISHVFLDCYNVSGVKAFAPFSEKVVVIFKRDWRIVTGSLKEIWVFLILFGLIATMGYASQIGGARKLINMLVKSHQITIEEYQRAGLKRCEIEGTFRWSDGTIQNARWLVVGLEGPNIICWDSENSRLIKDNKQGKFLRSILIQSETDWSVVKIDGIATAAEACFWYSGGKWHHSEKGNLIMGSVKAVSGKITENKITNSNSMSTKD